MVENLYLGGFMNILVTGANGFIGRNLVCKLNSIGLHNIFEFDKESSIDDLEYYISNCDFIFHIAGINRPKDNSEFMKGNFGLIGKFLELLKKYNNKCPILLTSSIQANLDNDYGKSKKAGEDLLFDYSKEIGSKVFIYRLPNVFGKWCRPNYNSAIATFCNNIANDLPITVTDRNIELNLVYIDDVIDEFISCIDDSPKQTHGILSIPTIYRKNLGQIVDLIYLFKKSRSDLSLPDFSDAFEKKLYSTYLSYLPKDQFSYQLKMNTDNRGSFTEFIKTESKGQISVNITKPGITKGNHWHHTKNEKFLVVSGKASIKFRKIYTEEIIEYKVSGDKLEVVDIPVGYTHSITNIGENDLVTVMWVNEPFEKNNPDTYYLQV